MGHNSEKVENFLGAIRLANTQLNKAGESIKEADFEGAVSSDMAKAVVENLDELKSALAKLWAGVLDHCPIDKVR